MQYYDEWITALLNLEIVDFVIVKKMGLPGRLRMLSESLTAFLLMQMIKDVTRYYDVVEHIKRVNTEYGYCTSMLMQCCTKQLLDRNGNFEHQKRSQLAAISKIRCKLLMIFLYAHGTVH